MLKAIHMLHVMCFYPTTQACELRKAPYNMGGAMSEKSWTHVFLVPLSASIHHHTSALALMIGLVGFRGRVCFKILVRF